LPLSDSGVAIGVWDADNRQFAPTPGGVEDRMKSQTKARRETWVVYRMPLKGQAEGINAVCDQDEWDAMEKQRPGVNTLIRDGITSEGEAERLARGKSGDPVPRGQKATQAATTPAMPKGVEQTEVAAM
jgi:hypothetical protein